MASPDKARLRELSPTVDFSVKPSKFLEKNKTSIYVLQCILKKFKDYEYSSVDRVPPAFHIQSPWLDLQHFIKLDMVAHACNLCTWKRERQEEQEFIVILSYIVSSVPA